MDCIFCKIINKEMPGTIVYEDDKVIAFKDVSPMAPVHVLIVPKQHVKSLMEMEDTGVIAHIYKTAQQLAKELGIADSGFRIVNNCGADGGQTVEHIHFHLLGGKKLNVTMC